MPEQSNDRIEDFFKKAAVRAEIPFNEQDWKKLEARLDAADVLKSIGPQRAGKITGTFIIGALLVATTVWLSATYNFPLSEVETRTSISQQSTQESTPGPSMRGTPESTDHESNEDVLGGARTDTDALERNGVQQSGQVGTNTTTNGVGERNARSLQRSSIEKDDDFARNQEATSQVNTSRNYNDDPGIKYLRLPVWMSDETIERDLVRILPTSIERNKQKAVVELPGAEEEQTREVEAMVEEEHASDQTKRVATPRLSLLLSFAPDFSGTSMAFYSQPGKAYGAMLHYHPFDKWSISAGVIKNHKVYSGDGEEYSPPKGYWKHYTNGVIPETVDGSCSILEFPIMVQYTIHNSVKHKWLTGVGVSSYLMQSESYRYNFGKPNPGAREGWDSRGSSRFMFNMVNFSIGYERRILPGLTLGLEPYAKIPLEEIGWSNLRLFSTGASLTLRYTILQKRTLSLPNGRAPN